MLPVTLLIVFLKNLLVVHIAGNLMKDKEEDVRDECYRKLFFVVYSIA